MESPNEQASPDGATAAPETTNHHAAAGDTTGDTSGGDQASAPEFDPAAHISRIAQLASEIRQYVGAGAHHLGLELERLATELASHL